MKNEFSTGRASILTEFVPGKNTPFVFKVIHDQWLAKMLNVFLKMLTPALNEGSWIETLRQWRLDFGFGQARLGTAVELTLKLASLIDPAMLLFSNRRYTCFFVLFSEFYRIPKHHMK